MGLEKQVGLTGFKLTSQKADLGYLTEDFRHTKKISAYGQSDYIYS